MLVHLPEDKHFRRSYYGCLWMTLVILLLLGCLPWQFKYPISGVLSLSPRNLVLKSPHAGLLENLEVKLGQKIKPGQILLRLQNQWSLEFATYYRQKMRLIRRKITKIRLEEQVQKQQLLKLKYLVTQHMVTKDYYQQVLSRLRQLQIQEQDALTLAVELTHQRFSQIQAPVGGQIMDIRVKVRDNLRKHQALMMIQPQAQTWMFKFYLPVSDVNKVFVGAKMRLSSPTHKRFHRYLISAQVVSISPLVKQHNGQSCVLIFAKILSSNAELLDNLPLDGVLLGAHHSWFYWVWKWIYVN